MAEEDAFNKPLDLSDELADVVGAKKLSRPQVTKRIWEYIKDNDLQKEEDKRRIVADDKLKPVFGSDEVSMFEMTKLISNHLTDPDA
ncbi:MAG: SWIB/MDM2 domain-containing protein [Bradymonadaceae bacterium]